MMQEESENISPPNHQQNLIVDDKECVRQLRQKCRNRTVDHVKISGSTTTRESSSEGNGCGYAVRSMIGTIVESPSSEIRSEELVNANDKGNTVSRGKAVINRGYSYIFSWR